MIEMQQWNMIVAEYCDQASRQKWFMCMKLCGICFKPFFYFAYLFSFGYGQVDFLAWYWYAIHIFILISHYQVLFSCSLSGVC
jgi:hypothetical protein